MADYICKHCKFNNNGWCVALKQNGLTQVVECLSFKSGKYGRFEEKTKKEENRGLYRKYIIQKVDGTPVEPMAEYFVLRVDKDPHARKALITYAKSVMEENPKFASEILHLVASYTI